jgi:outer membrane protein assembly factor BamB
MARTEQDCTRVMARLLQVRQEESLQSVTALSEPAGSAGAVLWGDQAGVCWEATGELVVAVMGVSGWRFLHRGPGPTRGRETVAVGDVVLLGTPALVGGVGTDRLTDRLATGDLGERVSLVVNEAERQGLEGPHALLVCRPASDQSGGPRSESAQKAPPERRATPFIWGAVGALCVVVAAFLVPRFGPARRASSPPSPAEPPARVSPGREDTVWYAPETYPAGEEIWRFHAERPITSSPLTREGRVFVGSRDGHLYCFKARDGTVEWSFAAGGGIGSSPCAGRGAVYVGCYDRRLYAVEETSGLERWRATSGGRVRASPVAWEDLVFFGSEDSCFYAVDAANGRVRWKWPTGGTIWARPTVVKGLVLVGSTDGVLHCYDARSGAPVWDHTASGSIFGSAVVAGDTVFVGSADGWVSCLAVETGRLHWKAQLDGGIHGTPCLCGGVLAVGSLSGALYGMNSRSGEIVWEFRTGGEVRSSPLALAGTIFVASYDTYLYALDARSGKLQWRFCVGSPIYSSPATDTSLVYVGSNGGVFVALGTGLPADR